MREKKFNPANIAMLQTNNELMQFQNQYQQNKFNKHLTSRKIGLKLSIKID